jgi:rare lipoprotein A
MILLTPALGRWLGSPNLSLRKAGHTVTPKQRRIATGSIAAAVLLGGGAAVANVTSQDSPRDTPVASTVELSSSPPSVLVSPASPSASAVSPPASATTPPAVTKSPAARQTSKAASRSAPRTTKVVSSGSCGASFYDEPQLTANGETFNPNALTAASKTLAFNTRVRVTSLDTGDSVIVRINDRGPYVDGRCLDLSRAAFDAIDDLDKGAVTVRYEVLG